MLALHRVHKSFGSTHVLSGFCLEAGAEEIVGILGPSGSGKTTLLNLLAGILHPDAGRVLRPRGIPGYVFQEPRLLPWRTAAENLGLGLLAAGLSPSQRQCRVRGYLERLQLRDVSHCYPHQLSAGMRQRVALGRALVLSPPCLLLDEPLRAQDYALRLALINLLLEEWQRLPRPVIYVTHDAMEAALAAHRILVVAGRPLRVEAELVPSTPPGRSPHDPEVLALQTQIHNALMGPCQKN
ncbi:MAG: ABC transporter ATP-binding protein [Anaerolineae bacterium]